MKTLEKIFDKVSIFLCRISVVIIWLLVIVVAVNVVGRKIFNVTVPGAIEIVQYGTLAMMALAMARTTFTGGHVSVSVITGVLPKAVRCVIEFLALMLSAALMVAALWICVQYIPQTVASGQVTEFHRIPFYLIYGVMAFGLVTAALTFVFNAVKAVYTTVKGDSSEPKGEIAE